MFGSMKEEENKINIRHDSEQNRSDLWQQTLQVQKLI